MNKKIFVKLDIRAVENLVVDKKRIAFFVGFVSNVQFELRKKNGIMNNCLPRASTVATVLGSICFHQPQRMIGNQALLNQRNIPLQSIQPLS
jgi:hypothetical protein